MLGRKVIRHVSSTVWPPMNILRLWWDLHCQEYNEDQESNMESLLEVGNFSDGAVLGGRPGGGRKKVPKGFLAVYVGPDYRRFVIPMSYLSMPEFRRLMDTMAEEFGFEQKGGLHIPYDEQDFEDVLVKCFQLHKTMSKIKKMRGQNPR